MRCLLFLSYISSDSLVWFQIYHCFLTPTSSLIINRRLSRTQTSVLRQYSLQWNANTFLHLKEGLVYCLRIKRICFLFLVFKFILLKNIVYNYFWYTAVIQLYIYIYIYVYNNHFRGLCHYVLLQNIEYSPLSYSRTLLFIHSISNTLHLLIPNSQSILPHPSPLATTSLFSLSVSLFPFHR